jgi:hypothetical protein
MALRQGMILFLSEKGIFFGSPRALDNFQIEHELLLLRFGRKRRRRCVIPSGSWKGKTTPFSGDDRSFEGNL